MRPTPDFFDHPQPAAVLKHGILKRYLPPFAFKVGSVTRSGLVAYIDGYAGRGTYEDGTPGSPAIAVDLADTIMAVKGDNLIVGGYFVEKDPAWCEALCELFDFAGIGWPVYEGDVEDHLVEIMDDIDDNTPLFAFLDPFGLNLPMDMIRKHLLSRSGRMMGGYRVEGAATEVLLNFSLHGLRRNAGHLDSKKSYKAKQKIVDRVDAMLGGEWWHRIWTSRRASREDEIREGYIQRFIEMPGNWGVFSVDVGDRLDGPPEYWLLYLTQHEDGAWLFNQAVSKSMEEHHDECVRLSGELDLDPLESRAGRWVDELAANMTAILDDIGSFRIGAHIGRVYGSTLGHAREMHVRKAVRRLHDAGLTTTTGTTPGGGRLQNLRVIRRR